MTDKGDVYINKDEIEENAQKLDALAMESNSIIYEASSVFPFQLFPDKIVIDVNKITVDRRDFLFQRVYPILIEDVLTVRLDRGILFASLIFEVNKFIQIARPITYLKPHEAATARQYIMGLVQAKKAGIDLSKLTLDQIRIKLKEIGKTQE